MRPARTLAKGRTVTVNIKPLEDRIVVKSSEAEQTTASGLVIPDTAKEKPQEGEVLAIGPGRVDDNGNRIPLDVAVGDKVIYSKYGGTEVKYSGEEFLILSARDVAVFAIATIAASIILHFLFAHCRVEKLVGDTPWDMV